MRVCGTTIYTVKGDSEGIRIIMRNPDESPYNFTVGDTIYLTVVEVHPIYGTLEPVFNLSEVVLAPTNEVVFSIVNETANMSVGLEYKYDIQWSRIGDSTRKTIIPFSDFFIIEEATDV